MKQKLTAAFLAFVTCLIFSHPAMADFKQADWQFFKDIQVPESAGSEYAFFQVDAEIYDGSFGVLQSLRIIDADSREAPYQMVTKRGSVHREEFSPRLLNNSYLAGRHNSFVLDLGEEPPSVNELTVQTTSTNFTRRASVEGSENQSEWNLLAEDAYIFDFSRNIRSKHLRIGFPLSNFRYLRVKVHDDGSGPLELKGAKIFRVKKEEAQAERWPLSIIRRTENKEERTTEIILDAGYLGLPIRTLELDVASRNYHRNVRIHSSEDLEEWVSLGNGIIFDYDLPRFKKTSTRLSFRENARGRYFRLTVENFDDRPLDIAGASGSGLVRRIVLPLTGKALYRTYFGNRKAKTPRYDLVHRIPYIETERLPHLSLGPRWSNPDYVVTKPVRPWSEEHAYLLWVFMGAVIAVLALLILNLMRKAPPSGAGG